MHPLRIKYTFPLTAWPFRLNTISNVSNWALRLSFKLSLTCSSSLLRSPTLHRGSSIHHVLPSSPQVSFLTRHKMSHHQLFKKNIYILFEHWCWNCSMNHHKYANLATRQRSAMEWNESSICPSDWRAMCRERTHTPPRDRSICTSHWRRPKQQQKGWGYNRVLPKMSQRCGSLDFPPRAAGPLKKKERPCRSVADIQWTRLVRPHVAAWRRWLVVTSWDSALRAGRCCSALAHQMMWNLLDFEG